MAHHLRAVALALAAAALGGGADFSHKLHLELIRDCSTCHTAARASTKAEDNLLPAAAVCRPCHGERSVRTTPPATKVAHFNHSIHLKIVPGGCAGCHGASDVAIPKMEQCLACHTKIEPTDSCALCHVVGPELKPASHTRAWGDLHSDPKIGKSGCWVCHGKRFTCQGCH